MRLTTDSTLNALGGTNEVAAALDLEPNTVSSWRERGIPPGRWPAIVDLAGKRGCKGITFEALATLRSRKKAGARS